MDLFNDNNPVGLTFIGSVDWMGGGYEYNETGVWKGQDGNLHWAQTSGCSCTTPYMEIDSIDDLTTGTRDELFAELDETLASDNWSGAAAEVAELKRKVAGF